MLSSLLRPKRSRRVEHSPFSSRFDEQSSPIVERRKRLNARYASADFTETDQDDEETEEDEDEEEEEEGDEDGDELDEDDDDDDDEDGDEDTPLLPIFSAAHLGMYLYRAMGLP
jgi:hypothetical protein